MGGQAVEQEVEAVVEEAVGRGCLLGVPGWFLGVLNGGGFRGQGGHGPVRHGQDTATCAILGDAEADEGVELGGTPVAGGVVVRDVALARVVSDGAGQSGMVTVEGPEPGHVSAQDGEPSSQVADLVVAAVRAGQGAEGLGAEQVEQLCLSADVVVEGRCATCLA